MKDKNVAALLAFFLGTFGIHRFYLGQVGLGIAYIMFFWIAWLIGFIDFIVFLAMDQKEFDFKYNRNFIRSDYLRRDTDFDRRQTYYEQKRQQQYRQQQHRRRPQPVKRTPTPAAPPSPARPNPYKISGIRKYKDYDFEGAIEDFKKVLADNSKDVAVHFNIACAYSIMEQADLAMYHISQAVEHGFVDFDKIQEHDALAYMRIQDGFEEFAKNGYRITEKKDDNDNIPNLLENPDLLDQLKQLGELRDRGLLTEQEFQVQKKRILRN